MKPTVLIADDDPLLSELVEHHLKCAGFDTITANSGTAALEVIRARQPNVAILDAMMPAMGGVEVLRRMQREGLFACTKAIMLTALSEEQNVVVAFKLGASDFVAKPFSPDELVLRTSRLLYAPAA